MYTLPLQARLQVPRRSSAHLAEAREAVDERLRAQLALAVALQCNVQLAGKRQTWQRQFKRARLVQRNAEVLYKVLLRMCVRVSACAFRHTRKQATLTRNPGFKSPFKSRGAYSSSDRDAAAPLRMAPR